MVRRIGDVYCCPYDISEEECEPSECIKGSLLECSEWNKMVLEGMTHECEMEDELRLLKEDVK